MNSVIGGEFVFGGGYKLWPKRICGESFFLVVVVFRFCFWFLGNCYYFVLLLFSCSLLRICENVLQVRLEFLGKTRDDFICVVNLFGF